MDSTRWGFIRFSWRNVRNMGTGNGENIIEEIENMSREELMGQILYLRKKCQRLEEKIDSLEWTVNPDRSGGQFTDDEINNRDGWL